jgi:hypothetical protein
MKLPFFVFRSLVLRLGPGDLVCCVIVVSWNVFPINPFLWENSPYLAESHPKTQHLGGEITVICADGVGPEGQTTRYGCVSCATRHGIFFQFSTKNPRSRGDPGAIPMIFQLR